VEDSDERYKLVVTMPATLLCLPNELLGRVVSKMYHRSYCHCAGHDNDLLHCTVHSLMATCKLLHETGAESQMAFFASILRDEFPSLSEMQLTRVECARLCGVLDTWRHLQPIERVGWSFEARELIDPTKVTLLARVTCNAGRHTVASAVLPWTPKTTEYIGINAATGRADSRIHKAHHLERAQFTKDEAIHLSGRYSSPETLFPEDPALQAGCDFDRGEAMDYMHARQTAFDAMCQEQHKQLQRLELDALVISWQAVPGSRHRALRWAPLIRGYAFADMDAPFKYCGDEYFYHAPHDSQLFLSEERVLSWHLRAICDLHMLDEHGELETASEETELSGHASDGANYGGSLLSSSWLEFYVESKTRLQQDAQPRPRQVHELDGLRFEFIYQMGDSLRRSARRQPPPHPLNLLLNRLAWRASNEEPPVDDEAEVEVEDE
jgi:hypothetical protein